MSKYQTIDFRQFVRNEYKNVRLDDLKVVTIGTNMALVLAPKTALAASETTFGNLFGAVMNIVDWIVVGVMVFSGVAWMFGHRTKALEMLIGGCIGYIIARHAVDIRDFLKTI
jgi:hypothetical protein